MSVTPKEFAEYLRQQELADLRAKLAAAERRADLAQLDDSKRDELAAVKLRLTAAEREHRIDVVQMEMLKALVNVDLAAKLSAAEKERDDARSEADALRVERNLLARDLVATEKERDTAQAALREMAELLEERP